MEVWSKSSGFLYFFLPFRHQSKPMRWVVGRGWLTDPTFPNLPSAHRKQIVSVSRTTQGETPENLPLQWFSEVPKKNFVRKSKKITKDRTKQDRRARPHCFITVLAEWTAGKEGGAAFATWVNDTNDR